MAPERRRGQSRQGKGGGPTSSTSQAQDESKEAEQGPPQQQPAPETSEDGARRPKRKKISPEQLEVLMGTFEQDRTPDLQIRQRLAAQLGLTNREVQVWFQNKRSALRRKEQAASSAASNSSAPAPHTVKSEADGSADKHDYEGPAEWREPASYPSSLAATAPQAGMSSQSSRPPTGSYEHAPPPLLAGGMRLASPEPMAASARMPIAGSSQQRQSLPPLTSLSRPSSSSAGQERLQHLSSLSSISDPIQFTPVLSPEPVAALERGGIPYVSSASSARGSSSSSSLLSGSKPGSGQFAEDPPPLPAPETNHLRLASTSGFAPEKPELPPPATMVQTAETSSSVRPGILPATATARPWTGDGTAPGSDSWGQAGRPRREPTERDYWHRRSQ